MERDSNRRREDVGANFRFVALLLVALVLGMAYALGVGYARALVVWLETTPIGG